MTKKHSIKKALLTSIMSLILCFAMLTGTTFAWFTDQETSANNKIIAGNLDVELYYQAEGQSDWTNVTETTNVFKANSLWEPGHTEVVKLKIVNEGSLALKYQLGVNVASEVGSINVNDVEFKLSDFIKFGIVDGAQNYTRDQAIAAVDATATTLKTAYNSDVTALEAKNDEKIVTMVVYMPTTVGNDANAKTGAAVPTIKLGINLFATQQTAESDSFDNQYDAGAKYPIVSAPVRVPAEDVSTPIILNANGMNVEVPATVVNNLPTEVTSISVAFSEPVVQNNTLTFASVELVDQNNNKLNLGGNSTMITITLPAQTAFSAGDLVYIYHDGELVDTTIVNADGTISYEASHFCEVSVSDTPKNVEAYADEAAKLRSLIAEAKNGDTVEFTLACDMYLNDRLNVPTGVTLILDGNGHTLYMDGTTEKSGSNNTAIRVENANIVIKNLTIAGIARYGVYTKGNSAFVNATFDNVTTDMVSVGMSPIYHNGKAYVTLNNCNLVGAGYSDGGYTDGTKILGGAETYFTVNGGYIGSVVVNANEGGAGSIKLNDGAIADKVICYTATNGSTVVKPEVSINDATVDNVWYSAKDVAQLKLVEDFDVILSDNVALGESDQILVNGTTLDGNGKTIDATASKINGIECAINTRGGVIKNLTITGPNARALGSGSNDVVSFVDDLYIDNVTIDYTYYALNGSINSNHSIYVTNSELNGWISYSGLNLLSFKNTTLAKGNTTCKYGLGYIVVYGDTAFENCTFDTFYMGMNQSALKAGAAGSTITISDSVVIVNGEEVQLTAENFKTLMMGPGDETDFGRMIENTTIIVDGVMVSK